MCKCSGERLKKNYCSIRLELVWAKVGDSFTSFSVLNGLIAVIGVGFWQLVDV